MSRVACLLAYLHIWREQRSGDSVQVGECELYRGVGKSELVQVGGAVVSGADVTLS